MAFNKIKSFFIACPANSFEPGIIHSSFLFWTCFLILLAQVTPILFFMYWPRDNMFGDITKSAIYSLTNAERGGLSLGSLTPNPSLEQAARLKGQDMMAKGYFSHDSPDGKTPWFWFQQVGYNYQYAGENLAIGFLEPKEVYNGWVQSFSHHQNILNPNYTEIGVAVVDGVFNGNRTTIVVQLFGQPMPAPVVQAPAQPQIQPKMARPRVIAKKATPTSSAPIKLAEEKPATPAPIVPPSEIAETTTLPEGVAGRAQIKPGEAAFALGANIAPLPQDWRAKLLQFFVYQYNDLLKKLSFYLLLLLCVFLLNTVIFCAEARTASSTFKTIFFISIFVLFVLAGQPSLIELIPHTFMIQ